MNVPQQNTPGRQIMHLWDWEKILLTEFGTK